MGIETKKTTTEKHDTLAAAENDANLVVMVEVTPGSGKGLNDPSRSIHGMGAGGVARSGGKSHMGYDPLVGEPGYTAIYMGGPCRNRGNNGRHETHVLILVSTRTAREGIGKESMGCETPEL